jgi:hypothetical protein
MARTPNRFPSLLVPVLLLAAYVLTGWFATLKKGPAFDESPHLTAGYSYWKFNDYRLQPENGNLPQRWAAAAVLPLNPTLDPSRQPELWRVSDVWYIGQKWLYETGNQPETLLAAGRAAMVLWGVAAALLVYYWSRHLWGRAGSWVSLFLCVTSPTMLTHGPMITSDMCAAFCLVAASGAFWLYLQKRGPWRLTLSLLLTGLAAVAKYSFVLLVPIYATQIAIHVLFNDPTRTARPPLQWLAARTTQVFGLTIMHALAATAIIWAAYGFRYDASAPELPPKTQFYVPWDQLLPEPSVKREILVGLKEYRIFPEAFTHGFAYVLKASEQRGAFAAGQYTHTGWWWFFPYTFWLKSTMAELCAAMVLLGWALLTLCNSVNRHRLAHYALRLTPLLTLFVVYGTAAIASHLNIGHRHILPLYLPLFIMAGALIKCGSRKFSYALAIGLVLLNSVETIRAYPNYLAYFNPMAGPADQRWRHLVDSSLDWGQELPALAEWLRENRHPGEPVYLSYFGIGDPRHEGIEANSLAPYAYLWSLPQLARLQPGLYCISATQLQDQYSPFCGPWTRELEMSFQSLAAYFSTHSDEFEKPDSLGLLQGMPDENRRWLFERIRYARLVTYLRLRPAEATLNASMLIYRLDAREVSLAVDASTQTWVRMIEKKSLETTPLKGGRLSNP